MRKAAILTVGRQLNDGETYIFSVYDLYPAGLLIRAYCSTTSAELTTAPSESELDTAGLSRSEEDLNKLAASYDIVIKGGQNFLQSSLKGINPPKAELIGDGVRQYIAATKAGDQTLPEFLTVALAELCKEKPAGLDAVKWLGQWMIDNNPNQPQIEEPED